ncbi:outer membrane beta-barrel protein [Flavobacterium endoglycinae]|uniref:Outer membrane beta-barrel protein n=1 Tax=Flavobacterium endoglycinae TaxID=2816357 RepID=A0ABX7QII0_9FLAO|nr:outer membrane beta-barrel protein [Flavobacterium endoglycinae]QSW90393.1 outer membrane beta-barrel protein [Flavobacterium endoglycinae]
MTKLISFLSLFFFFVFAANAQNDITVKGTVLDVNTQLPLELATVYFTTVKDSTVIEYATTDKNGAFRMNIKKFDKPVFLKVNYMGYQTYYEEYKGLTESKDFGKVYLIENVNALNDVVIKTEAAPITIKKDTLEFNAASYKVRPDSNVETLLKQLPGFDVDNDGKITVNGREVNQVLVNGKTFFDKDGAIAIKNLPADIIKKVQVSDFKTKKEELSKQESTSDFSSINITIDEKKNKGYFGKVMGGYGTDDRYEANVNLNFFNNKQKISLLASSNNINSTGFSMDDVFDNMSGGRNSSGRGGNSNSGSSGKGITQSNLVGINYSDDWTKDLLAMGSYNFSNTVNKNDSKANQLSFLPTGNIITESESKTRNESTGNNANFELEYKIDPKTRIVVAPKVSQSRTNSNAISSSSSEDENGNPLNESTGSSYSESNNTNFANTINFNKAFERKSRNLSVVFTNNNTNSDSDALNISETIFYQDNKPNDERNQKTRKKSTSDSYSADIEYTEPITDSLRIRIGSDFDWKSTSNDERTFNFDADTQAYTDYNQALSNYTSSTQNSVTPKVGVTLQKNKFTVNLDSRTSIVNFDNHSLYLNNASDLNKKYALPFATALLRYKFSRSKNLSFKYDYSNTLPSAAQLMPVVNLSNPLNTIVGNPDLNPIEKSSVNFNFRNYDFRSRSGYSVNLKGDYYDNDIVSTSVYDDSGKRTTTYLNISGVYNISLGANWNQSVKSGAHTLRYGLGISGNYTFDKGFTNAVLYNAKSTGITPKIYMSYDYGEILTIAPSYNLSYNQSKYENYSRDATSNVVHRINLQTTMYWPENLIFGNDFGYTYNSNISDGFKKDFYLWNTSLSYGFLDKKLYAKVKVYDVLNQNLSATRTISATSIRDEENTVLRRYVMFSLAYKIGNFTGSEKGGKRRSRD